MPNDPKPWTEEGALDRARAFLAEDADEASITVTAMIFQDIARAARVATLREWIAEIRCCGGENPICDDCGFLQEKIEEAERE